MAEKIYKRTLDGDVELEPTLHEPQALPSLRALMNQCRKCYLAGMDIHETKFWLHGWRSGHFWGFLDGMIEGAKCH